MTPGSRLSPRHLVRSALNEVDFRIGQSLLSIRGDRPGLLSVLFHAVMDPASETEIDQVVDPTQSISMAALDDCIRYFKEAGYTFVSPEDILSGLAPDGFHILITFDDGYWNNLRALPILEAHRVPALFFISTNYVETGRAFWWDVIHRERHRQGVDQESIWSEQARLKRLTHDRIDEYLVREFGEEALRPTGDEDRPMTPDELADFAKHPLVHIGNHTHDHGILTNYDFEGVLSQLQLAQARLEKWTGVLPRSVSYPNGNYSPEVGRAARAANIELGLTLRPERDRNLVPDPLAVGRFCLTRGETNEQTYTGYRSGVSFRRSVAKLARAALQR